MAARRNRITMALRLKQHADAIAAASVKRAPPLCPTGQATARDLIAVEKVTQACQRERVDAPRPLTL